ncbi:ATP-dependent DNA ligase [Rhizobium laguerreae]|nr:ATP-dependent DNA ligase [Rhizobium laguerreae]
MAKRTTKPPRSAPLVHEDEALRGGRRNRRDPAQPDLPFDPMPDRVVPALALLKSKAPSGPRYIHEVKWDGYRLAIHLSLGRVRLVTRGGHDWTHRFPSITAAAMQLPAGSAILDGEAVVLDDAGRSDFAALQQALGGRSAKRSSAEPIYMAFDLVYLDGHDLRNLEQESRRHLLEDLVPPEADGGIRLSQEIEGDGPAIFSAACGHGLEGIVSKDRDAPYVSGRGGQWLKIKCIQSQGFAILGYRPSSAARGGIGRLLLGARRDGRLVYVGGVGTGFTEKTAKELRQQLDGIRTERPVAGMGRKKTVIFVEPSLVAEIEFRAWTDDGKLRHASYKGLRDPDDGSDVYELES